MVDITAIDNNDLSCSNHFGSAIAFQNDARIFAYTYPDTGRFSRHKLYQAPNSATVKKVGIKDNIFYKTKS